MIRTAMIFAAGRGERMRPLSDATPKPLLRVGDKMLMRQQLPDGKKLPPPFTNTAPPSSTLPAVFGSESTGNT